MRVEVRGKQFEIELVNNYVHEQYSKLADASFEIVRLPSEARELQPGEMKSGIKKLNGRMAELKKVISDTRKDILRELLESNGYQIDLEWWKRKTDPDDINNFIIGCIKKDSDGKKEKKK